MIHRFSRAQYQRVLFIHWVIGIHRVPTFSHQYVDKGIAAYVLLHDQSSQKVQLCKEHSIRIHHEYLDQIFSYAFSL